MFVFHLLLLLLGLCILIATNFQRRHFVGRSKTWDVALSRICRGLTSIPLKFLKCGPLKGHERTAENWKYRRLWENTSWIFYAGGEISIANDGRSFPFAGCSTKWRIQGVAISRQVRLQFADPEGKEGLGDLGPKPEPIASTPARATACALSDCATTLTAKYSYNHMYIPIHPLHWRGWRVTKALIIIAVLIICTSVPKEGLLIIIGNNNKRFRSISSPTFRPLGRFRIQQVVNATRVYSLHIKPPTKPCFGFTQGSTIVLAETDELNTYRIKGEKWVGLVGHTIIYYIIENARIFRREDMEVIPSVSKASWSTTVYGSIYP